ncbi:DUF4861 family protein [Sphingomonas panacisoli]|nr:DUF4861 family protein [Sphingomonas panacisoli]
MPAVVDPLPAPVGAARAPRATVALAPYRFDDLLFENDRIAHRIYGRALEKEQPPSSSGIDVWGKNVRWPFMERQLHGGDQHRYHGEGLDFFEVGTSRGGGGLGIWYDNKLWVSRNYRSYRILKNGPDVASFDVNYAAWPVDTARTVTETRRFTLPVGMNFTRMVSTMTSSRPGELIVGIGINKHAVSLTDIGTLVTDRARGRMTWWSGEEPDKGAMGVAVMVDPAAIVGFTQDFDNYLVLVRVTPGKPFVYYTGGAWSRGLDFHTKAEWQAYVNAQQPDFDPRR